MKRYWQFVILGCVLGLPCLGCVTQFEPLKSCQTNGDCFLGEVCVETMEGDGRCLSEGSMPETDSRAVADSDLNDASMSSDINVDNDVAILTDTGTSGEDMFTPRQPTPLVRWQFTRDEPSPLFSTGEINGLTFLLKGDASLDVNGLNLRDGPADAVSTNAFLSGNTSALFTRLTQTNSFSIRLWVWTNHKDQTGPARIFTWSQDSTNRNLTIGQESDGKVVGRVRFDNGLTNENGVATVEDPCEACLGPLIETTANSLSHENGFQQVVMQYDASGILELWVDDTVVSRSCAIDDVPGGFSTWDPAFGIALGDELFNAQPRRDTVESMDSVRPWDGVIHSLEIYDQAFDRERITQWITEKPAFQPYPTNDLPID